MRLNLTIMMAAIALIAAGCGSIFKDDSVMVNREQCWAEVYEDARFIQDRPWTRIQGPTELKNIDKLAGYDWNDKISSIRVGPDATIQVYEHAGFRGEVREYGPGRTVSDLNVDRLNDRVSSIKLRCR